MEPPRQPPEHPSDGREKVFPTAVAPHRWPKSMGPIPSIHHFPWVQNNGPMTEMMGWTPRPEAIFTNVTSAKLTFVNVNLSRPIYKFSLLYKYNIVKF